MVFERITTKGGENGDLELSQTCPRSVQPLLPELRPQVFPQQLRLSQFQTSEDDVCGSHFSGTSRSSHPPSPWSRSPSRLSGSPLKSDTSGSDRTARGTANGATKSVPRMGKTSPSVKQKGKVIQSPFPGNGQTRF